VSVTLCNFCKTAPTITNSHVVPRFIGSYIMKNSPFGYMMNLWARTKQYDLYKGPYLCAACDNTVFSRWENHYSQHVWPNPLAATTAWGDVATINFFLSVAYRYAIHFLATSPILSNAPKSVYIRDLCEKALQQSGEIGKSVFVYPYVHQPIGQTCDLLPGVNHLLELAVHAEHLPPEGDLPTAILILTPKVLSLICDGDLAASTVCTMKKPTALRLGALLDPSIQNSDMPWFLSSILNRYIGHGQGHQKGLGRWKRLAYSADKMINPWKMCYKSNLQDQALHDWQKANCKGSEG
jgi:hypothetical protein